eukprot:4753388-Prymnesium_polylepis.1
MPRKCTRLDGQSLRSTSPSQLPPCTIKQCSGHSILGLASSIVLGIAVAAPAELLAATLIGAALAAMSVDVSVSCFDGPPLELTPPGAGPGRSLHRADKQVTSWARAGVTVLKTLLSSTLRRAAVATCCYVAAAVCITLLPGGHATGLAFLPQCTLALFAVEGIYVLIRSAASGSLPTFVPTLVTEQIAGQQVGWLRAVASLRLTTVAMFPWARDGVIKSHPSIDAGGDPGYLTLVFGFNTFWLAVGLAPISVYG